MIPAIPPHGASGPVFDLILISIFLFGIICIAIMMWLMLRHKL